MRTLRRFDATVADIRAGDFIAGWDGMVLEVIHRRDGTSKLTLESFDNPEGFISFTAPSGFEIEVER